jgi:hypothetical protein
VESGKRDNRPELAKALEHARLTGATLLIANRLTFERPSNLALCSDAGQTSKARSGGRHFDLRPGAKDGDSLGQEAVAMEPRRRSKNRVVEAMARIVALLPIGQEPARPNCDVDVDRVDSVAEGCNESVEPLMQRVSPFRRDGEFFR